MTETIDNVISKGMAYTQAEAALCVWEYALEKENKLVYGWLAGGEGACMARSNCIEIAHFIEIAYQSGNGDDDAFSNWSFDWDVVPVIVQCFKGWCPGGTQDITPAIAIEVGIIAIGALSSKNTNQKAKQNSDTIKPTG